MFPKCNSIGAHQALVFIAFFTTLSPAIADERSPIWSAQREAKSSLAFVDANGDGLPLNSRGSFGTPSELESYTLAQDEALGVDPAEEWISGPLRSYGFGGLERNLTMPSMDPWSWQLLPTGIVYKAYLASQKESRFATEFNHIPERNDTFWEPTLGTRVGILRYGDDDPVMPQGFQIDAEGSAQTRLNLTDNVDVTSVDFRGGLPITYGYGAWRFKTGYYHLSSHLGDEFLLKNPNYPRLNYARDTILLGAAYYLTDDIRVYSEVGWAFFNDVSNPWEVQFGVDYAPAAPTGPRGAPFLAVNGHLRQELGFSGNVTVQAGWAWRSAQNGSLLRIGGHYFNGSSWQYSFYNRFEQQLGLGVWYDF